MVNFNRRQFLFAVTAAATAGAALGMSGLEYTRHLLKRGPLEHDTLKLSNGVKAYILPNDSGLVSALLRVNYGAINEKKRGIAHLAEHLLLNGGAGPYNSDQTKEFWDRYLPSRNAWTTLEHIGIPAGLPSSKVEKLIEVGAYSIFEPRFEEKPLEEEKKRVLQEIVTRTGKPSFGDYHEYRKKLYGENHPYAYKIAGEPEIIKQATVEDVKEFWKGAKPNLLEVFLVGTVPRNIDYLIEKHFGRYARDDGVIKEIPIVRPVSNSIEFSKEASDLKEGAAELAVGWNTEARAKHKDVYAMRMLDLLLGTDSDSRLFKELSEKQGLVYGIESDYSSSKYNGYFGVSCKTGADPEKVLKGIFVVMSSMKEIPVTQEDIRIKAQNLLDNYLPELQGNSGKLDEIKKRVDTGISYEDSYRGLRQVTPQQVMDAARKYLPERGGNYVLIKRIGTSK